MKVLVTDHNEILTVPAEDLTGGTIVVNGTSYKIHPEEIDSLPEGAKDCEYIFVDGMVLQNPNYIDDSISTRLNDIEQILIDLLDTI